MNTCADYLALMVEGNSLDILYELTQEYLKTVTNWAAESDLATNFSKTELFYSLGVTKSSGAYPINGRKFSPAALMTMHTDSNAAIPALSSLTVRSTLLLHD